MKFNYFIQQSLYILRHRCIKRTSNFLNNIWLVINGMKIGKGTRLSKCNVTWPHQVSIGNYCTIENNIFFKYDGIWKVGPSIIIKDNVFVGNNCEFNITTKLTIENDCLIASGCKFIDHNHNFSSVTKLIRKQVSTNKPIHIGPNVWLGYNVVVLMGVEIGEGAVVAAGSIVVKSIPSFEIWGGVPAKKIKNR